MIEKPYNHKCACGSERAYKGFFTIECPNKNCNYYSYRQSKELEEYDAKVAMQEKDEELLPLPDYNADGNYTYTDDSIDDDYSNFHSIDLFGPIS